MVAWGFRRSWLWPGDPAFKGPRLRARALSAVSPPVSTAGAPALRRLVWSWGIVSARQRRTIETLHNVCITTHGHSDILDGTREGPSVQVKALNSNFLRPYKAEVVGSNPTAPTINPS
jgi:hypothetical protein